MLLELSFGCLGVEEISGVAVIAAALRVEAKRKKADDSHNDGLCLFLDLTDEVVAARYLGDGSLDDLADDGIEFVSL